MPGVLLGAGLLVTLLYGLHAGALAPGERIFAQLAHGRAGMSRAQVQALLGPPDTTYRCPATPYSLILHCGMGPLAPDAVRIVIAYDTVTAVSYPQ